MSPRLIDFLCQIAAFFLLVRFARYDRDKGVDVPLKDLRSCAVVAIKKRLSLSDQRIESLTRGHKKNKFLAILEFSWKNIDTVTVVVLAAYFSFLGINGSGTMEKLIAATLATLAILAIAICRERGSRDALMQRLEVAVSRLIAPPADAFFTRQSEERNLIEGAEQQILLVQETGSLISETCSASIKNFLKSGGRVKLVLSAPLSGIARFMAFRNESLTPDAILGRSSSFVAQMEGIVQAMTNHAERLEVRYCPYPFSSTLTIVDPTSASPRRREVLVRHAGFMVPLDRKLDFIIHGDTSPDALSHYHDEFSALFHHSSKVILLSGPPRSGKSTLLHTLLKENEGASDIVSVLSIADYSDNERTGFTLHASFLDAPVAFAERRGEKYELTNSTIWKEIAEKLDQARLDGKIVVLDEIGPLQLQVTEFKAVIDKIIADPASTLFATIHEGEESPGFIAQIKTHYRVSVKKLTPASLDGLHDDMREELKASLRVAKFLPRASWTGA